MTIRYRNKSLKKRDGKVFRIRRGFNLVELLVVLAIIAILVTILLPSLNSAREMAKSIVCCSNMKQYGYSFLLYSSDNRDFCPNMKWFSNDTFRRYLTDSVPADPYYYPEKLLCPASYAFQEKSGKQGNIGRSYANFFMNNDPVNQGNFKSSYAKNASYRNDYENEGYQFRLYVLLRKVANPGQKYHLFDALSWDVNVLAYENGHSKASLACYLAEGREHNGGYLAYRHKCKANFLFYDGHVSSLVTTVADYNMGDMNHRYPWFTQTKK